MFKFFDNLGWWLSQGGITLLILGLWFGVGGLLYVRVKWTCMFCGKLNDTNLFMAFFNWCDHDGV